MPDNLRLQVQVEVDANTGELRVVEQDLGRLRQQTAQTATTTERTAAATDRLTAATARQTPATRTMGAAMSQAGAATQRLHSHSARLARGMAQAGRAQARAAERTAALTARLRALVAEQNRQRLSAEQSRRATLGLGSALAGLYVGGRVLSGIVQTSAAFEQLRIRLRVFSGSAEAARARFAELQDYAARTPFALREVVDGFLQLEATNFRPQLDDLRALGDIASASGRSLGELTQALAAVGRGENDPIEGFGFQVRKVGEEVRIEWRDTVRTVENSRTAILAAFVDIARSEQAFEGATEQLADSLTGALSNFGDSLDRLQDRIGRGGLAGAVGDLARSVGAIADQSDGAAAALGALAGLGVRLAPAALAVGAVVLQVRLLSGAHRVLTSRIGGTVSAYARLQRRMGLVSAAAVGLRRSLTALGGPVGVAILAAEALALFALNARGAADDSDELGESVLDLVQRLDELSQSARAKLAVDIEVDIDSARAQLDALLAEQAALPVGGTGRRNIEARQRREQLEQDIAEQRDLLRQLGAAYQQVAQHRDAALGADADGLSVDLTAVRQRQQEQAERAGRRRFLADIERLDRAHEQRRRDALLSEVDLTQTRRAAQERQAEIAFREEIERLDEAHRQRLAANATAAGDNDLSALARLRTAARGAFQDYADDAASAAEAAREAIGRGLHSMEDALTQFVTTGRLSFSSLVDSILADLARLVVRQSITGPLAQALSGALGGFFSGGGAGGAGGGGFANSIAGAPTFHSGGRVGALGGRRRFGVDPALFVGAPRLHQGGRVGREVPIIAQEGERVLSRSETAAYEAGPRAPRVEINLENRGSPAEATVTNQRWDGDTLVIDLMLDDMARRGPFTQGLQRTFGLRERSV